MKKLILIGGGHAHVEVLRQFGLQPPADVEITLVSPDRHTPYSGMLPGLIAGHYTFEQCHIDLQPLAAAAGARHLPANAQALDATQRVVTLSDGSKLDYDVASINVGSTPVVQGVEGAAQHAIMVKPVAGFLTHWTTLIERVRAGSVTSIVVVGGGAAGVEMLLAMQHYFANQTPRQSVGCGLVTDAPQLLAQHNRGVRAVLTRNLARKRVAVHCGLRVSRVEAQAVIATNAANIEQRIKGDAIVWVTGAAPPAWLSHCDLNLNDKKFININNNLQSTNHSEVFAVGDCATIAGPVYPKSGVYAVRQGPILAHNLRAALSGTALQTYTPQPRALALISTGERHAIASWGPLALHGNWVWRWKDSIDRAFMARYCG